MSPNEIAWTLNAAFNTCRNPLRVKRQKTNRNCQRLNATEQLSLNIHSMLSIVRIVVKSTLALHRHLY